MNDNQETINIANTEAQPETLKERLIPEVYSWVGTIVFTVLFVALVTTFIFRIAPVNGISMLPTLSDGDNLITTTLHGEYKHGDIVVVRRQRGTPLVKRVIGVEGDKINIDFEAGIVYRNGEALDEPYINEPTSAALDFKEEVIVPEGHVFIMGDNRNHSDDSRSEDIGMIDCRNIYGKVIFRLSPFENMGII